MSGQSLRKSHLYGTSHSFHIEISLPCVLQSVLILLVAASTVMGVVIGVPGDRPTIQDGINAATHGDTVLVAPGTYVENINYRGKNIVLASHFILGGDAGLIETTVIDGSNPTYPDSASCVTFCSGEDSTAVLQGFTVTGGVGTRMHDGLHSMMWWRSGGGILVYMSSPTIRDNIITGNAVLNTTNVSGAHGGGLHTFEGNPYIYHNIVRENQAGYGAGIITDYSGARIERNIICDNSAGNVYGGGGYWTIGSGPGPILLQNNTIVNNFSASNGGAISLYGVGAIVIAKNNIIWGNTQNQGGQINGTPEITYSDVEGGYPGEGNININPLFEDDAYTLSQHSPCIDAGDPDSPFDPDGTRTDMGAFTYSRFDAPLIRIKGSLVDDSQGNNNRRADAGETVTFIVTLSNTRLNGTVVSATLASVDPDVEITGAVAGFGDLPRDGETDNSADPFSFSVDPTSEVHPSVFHLTITADGGYIKSDSLEILIGTSSILLIDDDGGEDIEEYYSVALDYKQIYPETWDVSGNGCPPADKLGDYETVIWLAGNDRQSSLTSEEQNAIAFYLDGGGHLVVIGANIGYDLVEDGSPEDAAFYSEYLHADYIGDDISETFVNGIAGDPVTGQYALLSLQGQMSPDVIAPLGSAGTIMTYNSTRQGAAIKYSDGYKLVYFVVGLECITPIGGGSAVDVRGTLLQNAVNWFNYNPTAGDVNQDGTINVLDVLSTINIILGVIQPTPDQEWAADCTGDATVNILDALGIVNVVLGIGTCGP